MSDAGVAPNSPKADVTILAGFLGAGKTTLLKRILSWDADLSETAVIVNEFGDVGIDGSMLKDSTSNMVEFKSGCVCCVLKAQFNVGLKKIWKELKPKRIFIESTGVADPGEIVKVFKDPGIREHMEVRKIVTVVDAEYWEAREHLGPLFFHQIEDANLILLNKIDIIGEDDIPKVLGEIHERFPGVQVVPTRYCGVDPETLWAVDPEKDLGMRPAHFYEKHDHEHSAEDHQLYVSFHYVHSDLMDETRFMEFTENLPWEVFRMKGPVRFKDNTRLINFVGGKSEWIDWEDIGETRLAFVGMGVNPDSVLDALKLCVADS